MRRFFGALAAFMLCCLTASADEGMWTFDNVPAAQMRAAYGWAPDQAWLDRVRLGSGRIQSGCSAAIMSANGLVQTNHHCVVGCVANLSSTGNDLVHLGFRALRRADERRCPNAAIDVLTDIADVTGAIESAAQGVSPENFAAARDATIARLEGACANPAQHRRCEVVTLYQGGQYKLYGYHRYDDIRLVFAPEREIAHFGGDPDNFNFPRFGFDVSFVRLYEDGRPARTPNHLLMRTSPLRDGEMTLVSGDPGATERLMTTAQLAFQRDAYLPFRLFMLSELRGRLLAFSAEGAEQARIASDTLYSTENSFKAFSGRRLALTDDEAFARVTAAEADLRARVQRDPFLSRDVGPAWDEIARATTAYRGFFQQYQFVEPRFEASELLTFARHIVRAADDRAKPNDQRLPAYTDARLPATAAMVMAPTPIEPALEELKIAFWLSKLREYLTPDDPLVRRVLGNESPEALAHRLVSQTQLGDAAARRALWEGGQAAVAASSDPLIVFVRAWDSDARAIKLRYQREYEGPVARAQERIARARFRLYGQSLYPDATFTPRLSYGRVQGWTEPGGRVIAPFTQVSGLWARATDAFPYALPPSWAAARGRISDDILFNVVTTNDVIGGNSGSPVLDRDGRVVGAVFDGNIYSLGGDYFYDAARNRTVIVTSQVIEAGLRNVYGMGDLADELVRGE